MIGRIGCMALCLLLALPAVAGRSVATYAEPSDIASMTPEEAQQMVGALSPLVENLRGLKFKNPVPVRVVNDRTTRDHLKARLAKFWPESQRRAEQEAWTRLGLLSRATGLIGTLLSVLEEQAGGFYDPDQDTFFLLDDMPRRMAPMLMVHELTHALDDQHFGIDGLLDRVKEDNDRMLALSAVVEGSGTAVMTAYLLEEIDAGGLDTAMLQEFRRTDAGRARKLRSAPAILQRSLLAPYFLGRSFLVRGGSAATADRVNGADLDQAFAHPPESTEQVLHPEKYWDEGGRDRPRDIPLTDLAATLGEGWSLSARGTMGELYLALLTGGRALDPDAAALAQPADWTNTAATGWGGDLWQLYESDGRSVALLASLWDTEQDAAEFEAALVPAAGRWVGRRADAVVLVAGDDDTPLAALGNAALSGVGRAAVVSAPGAGRTSPVSP